MSNFGDWLFNEIHLPQFYSNTNRSAPLGDLKPKAGLLPFDC